jgi:hypothetical protein
VEALCGRSEKRHFCSVLDLLYHVIKLGFPDHFVNASKSPILPTADSLEARGKPFGLAAELGIFGAKLLEGNFPAQQLCPQ